ncbi:NUDIX domain-containing protein [Calidifontibacter terrae]
MVEQPSPAPVKTDGRLEFDPSPQVPEADALRTLQELTQAILDAGSPRAELRVDANDRRLVRLAARSGMRKEGVVRSGAADGGDQVQFARTAQDPPPADPSTFTAVLNAGLPTKRAIAQAIVRDDEGRILVCELVYKRFWDLPGGVVDPGESPAEAVRRELAEELGVVATLTGLRAVSWLPPWRGWDDATLFVFDAVIDRSPQDLQPREIRAIHWVAPIDLTGRVADYTDRVVQQALATQGTVYLEDGYPPLASR